VVYTGRTGEKTYGFNVVRAVYKDGAEASDNSPVTVYYQSDSAAVSVSELEFSLTQTTGDPIVKMTKVTPNDTTITAGLCEP